MTGGKAARWADEDIADTLTGKAVQFIEQHKDKPFFLYFAPNDIHEPMAPHSRFKGTSGCGTRGDAIHELDWSVGEVLSVLDRLGLTDNTLVIFSSDNGGAIKDTYDDGTNELHGRQAPNGPLRGDKFSPWEGGHREPFVARWPGRIKPGTTSAELVCLVDMLSTLVNAAGGTVPKSAGPDSFNVLSALEGKGKGRESLVMHVSGPDPCAIRKGSWKLIVDKKSKTSLLFRLDEDLAEKHNIASKYPDKVRELEKLLEKIKMSGQSRN
jgi:arylsulfatase A-like enzyme